MTASSSLSRGSGNIVEAQLGPLVLCRSILPCQNGRMTRYYARLSNAFW
jgi:hypothetical protein